MFVSKIDSVVRNEIKYTCDDCLGQAGATETITMARTAREADIRLDEHHNRNSKCTTGLELDCNRKLLLLEGKR